MEYFYVYGWQSNQPLLAGGLTSGIKQKPYLAVSYYLCGNCEAARCRPKKVNFLIHSPCISALNIETVLFGF
jgi:hypothetical protein